MATLKTIKEGVEKEFSITDRQAEMLQGFIINDEYGPDVEINGVKKSEIMMITFDKKVEKPFVYSVRLSYNNDGQDVLIGKSELSMVMWAFMKDAKAICKNGMFRGKDIISVMPDYGSMLGFNRGYDMQSEDFTMISRDTTCIEARNFYNGMKQMCLESKTFPELSQKANQLLLK